MEIEGYELPDELYYTQDHVWARVEDDGNVRVGMNSYGAVAAGTIEFIDLPAEDDEFEAGEAFGSLESAKWVGGLTMPVSGKIIEVNEDIEDDLELIAEEPYGDGWLVLIEPSKLDEDLEKLIHGDAIKPWFEEDFASRQ